MTWLCHMRAPRRLWRDLGPAGFAGFQVLFLGFATLCMPGFLRASRRLFSIMATPQYVPGTHSMAYVIVPNMEVAKKIAG